MQGNLEQTTLKKLDGYAKPIKTKQIADRLGVDRLVMAETLNKLFSKNLITWCIPKRDNERQYVGWLRIRN